MMMIIFSFFLLRQRTGIKAKADHSTLREDRWEGGNLPPSPGRRDKTPAFDQLWSTNLHHSLKDRLSPTFALD
jgi:hypothetical protein